MIQKFCHAKCQVNHHLSEKRQPTPAWRSVRCWNYLTGIFKAAIIKMVQRASTNAFITNEKRKSYQWNKNVKEETHGNYRAETHNIRKQKLNDGLINQVEMIENKII